MSNDLQNWVLADGRELTANLAGFYKDCFVLGCPCSVRYFALMIAGAANRFTLTHFTIEYETRYADRAR